MHGRLAFLFVALLPVAAEADVKGVDDRGFRLESRIVVRAAPAEAFRALADVGRWWHPDHTYSGRAANLSLDPRAGGCFCETLADGGSVEHARVVYARPADTLRLVGSLGPLQAEAVVGTLTWSLKAGDGGTEITQTYVVGGRIDGDGARWAAVVDRVLSEQVSRLGAHLDRRQPVP